MTKARLKDVAAAAGVSQGTASNVFNRPDLVNDDTRALVLEAAERLGYAGPQPAARMLRSGKAGLVALLSDESASYLVSDIYGRRLLAGVARACDSAGVGITLVGGAAAAESGSAWSLETALVDGFVLHCFEEEHEIFTRLERRGLPFVTIDGGRRTARGSVAIDDETAAARAMAMLVEAGHRKLGVLSLAVSRKKPTGPLTLPHVGETRYETTALRIKGYLAAAASVGLRPEDIPAFQTDKSEESAVAGVDWLMGLPSPPTAIAAMSDVNGMVAISRLKALGYRVPEDVSVVGFDGVPEAAYADPPLSTIAQPAEEKGVAAVEMLLGARPMTNLLLDAQPIVRGSIAPRSD